MVISINSFFFYKKWLFFVLCSAVFGSFAAKLQMARPGVELTDHDNVVVFTPEQLKVLDSAVLEAWGQSGADGKPAWGDYGDGIWDFAPYAQRQDNPAAAGSSTGPVVASESVATVGSLRLLRDVVQLLAQNKKYEINDRLEQATLADLIGAANVLDLFQTRNTELQKMIDTLLARRMRLDQEFLKNYNGTIESNGVVLNCSALVSEHLCNELLVLPLLPGLECEETLDFTDQSGQKPKAIRVDGVGRRAIAFYGAKTLLWDVPGRRPIKELVLPDGASSCVQWSCTGDRFALWFQDGDRETARIYQAETGTLQLEIPLDFEAGAAFLNSDLSVMAVEELDQDDAPVGFVIFDAKSGAQIKRLRDEHDELCATFHPTEPFFAIVHDHVVEIFNINNWNRPLASLPLPPAIAESEEKADGHVEMQGSGCGMYVTVSFSVDTDDDRMIRLTAAWLVGPDGNTTFLGCGSTCDSYCSVGYFGGEMLTTDAQSHENTCNAMSSSSDYSVAVSGDGAASVVLDQKHNMIKVRIGNLDRSPTHVPPGVQVLRMALSHDGRLSAIVSSSPGANAQTVRQDLCIYDFSQKKLLRYVLGWFQADQDAVCNVTLAFSPSSRHLLVNRGFGRAVWLYDLEKNATRVLVRRQSAPSGDLPSVSARFSDDGRFVFLHSKQGFEVRDVHTGSVIVYMPTWVAVHGLRFTELAAPITTWRSPVYGRLPMYERWRLRLPEGIAAQHLLLLHRQLAQQPDAQKKDGDNEPSAKMRKKE